MEKRLYRDEYRKKVAGVCAGLSDYFTVDVAIVRLIFVLACIFHGGGLLIYIVLWIVLPKRPYPLVDPTVDYTVPPQNPGERDPYNTGTPFGGSPYSGNPFPNQPFTDQPFPPKRSGNSTAAIIVGAVLIVVGGSVLLDNLDIISWWDFWHFWPIIPIAIGLVLMMSSGDSKKKMSNTDWQSAPEVKPEETKEENKTDSAAADDAEPKA